MFKVLVENYLRVACRPKRATAFLEAGTKRFEIVNLAIEDEMYVSLGGGKGLSGVLRKVDDLEPGVCQNDPALLEGKNALRVGTSVTHPSDHLPAQLLRRYVFWEKKSATYAAHGARIAFVRNAVKF